MTRERVAVCLVVGVLVASRLPLAPYYLFDWDNVNFALALQRFDPLASQPQTPGYPFFVLLCAVFRPVVGTAMAAQVWAGLLGSIVAVLYLGRLGDALFGKNAGICAMAVFCLNAAFWLAGDADPVRVFLASGAVMVAFFVWTGRLNAAGLAWGIAGGFRPELCVVLAPLFFSRLFVRRVRVRQYLAPALIAGAITAAWATFVAGKMGGYGQMVSADSSVPLTVFRRTSGWLRAVLLTYWVTLGAASWIWALPVVYRRLRVDALRDQVTFLLCWFVPAFTFNAVLMFAVPDHALASIPVVCLAGGLVLSKLLWPEWAAVIAAGVNVLLFFAPPKRLGREASYRLIRHQEQVTARSIEAVGSMAQPVTVYLDVSKVRGVTWRQISYYFPTDLVVVRLPNGGTLYARDCRLVPKEDAEASLERTVRIDRE